MHRCSILRMQIADCISNAERYDAPHMFRSPSSLREERGPPQYFGRIVCATSTTNRPLSATACASPPGAWQRLYATLHKVTDRQAWCCIREDGHVVNRPQWRWVHYFIHTNNSTSILLTHIPHFIACGLLGFTHTYLTFQFAYSKISRLLNGKLWHSAVSLLERQFVTGGFNIQK